MTKIKTLRLQEGSFMDRNLKISFSEAKYVLKQLSKDEQRKIPEKLRRFIAENCDDEHIVDVNKLSRRTYALLAVMYRKYLADNKAELEAEYQQRLQAEKKQRGL